MGLAIVPGSFDPVTWGHVDIIRRAARLFDRVIALVMVNDQKQALFTPEERLYMLRESVRGIQRVEADFYGGHRERLNGAQAAAAGCNMSFSVLGDHDYMEQAARITAAAKNAGEKPAFLCSGDIYAGYIILNLQKKGFTAGVDYGIMGFDRLDLMQMLPISLASVENNVEQIGNEAIGLLLDMIENDRKKQTIYVPYQIIDGTSL